MRNLKTAALVGLGVLLFARTSFGLVTVWTQDALLTASDGEAGDLFGNAIAIDGDTMLVGTEWDEDAAIDAGSVYVFTGSGTTWTEVQKLYASDGMVGDQFGTSVAIQGDSALVGAVGCDPMIAGAVYVFTRDGDVWNEQQKITLPVEEFAMLGDAVAMSGDRAVLGSRGGALVFSRSGDTWIQQQNLVPSDNPEYTTFGHAVALDGDTAVVGMYSPSEPEPGAAYVFEWDGASWNQTAKLEADDAVTEDGFGVEVRLRGDVLFVGATMSATEHQGAVYVFERSESTWSQVSKLVASDGEIGNHFGGSIALEDNFLTVGAADKASGTIFPGAAYLFKWDGDTWAERAKLIADDPEDNDCLGGNVAIHEGSVFVSATSDNEEGNSSGSIFLYDIPEHAGGDCANPFVISELPYSNTHSTVKMSDSISTFLGDCGEGVVPTADDVYELSLDPGETARITVEPQTGLFDVAVRLVEQCENDQSCLVYADDLGPAGAETLDYQASGSQPVYVVVEGAFGSAEGEYNIEVELVTGPENDGGADTDADTDTGPSADAAGGRGSACGCVAVGASKSSTNSKKAGSILSALLE